MQRPLFILSFLDGCISRRASQCTFQAYAVRLWAGKRLAAPDVSPFVFRWLHFMKSQLVNLPSIRREDEQQERIMFTQEHIHILLGVCFCLGPPTPRFQLNPFRLFVLLPR